MLIKKEGNYLRKYDVYINKKELENLRFEIIVNCSNLKHITEEVREDHLCRDRYNIEKVINYNETFIRKDCNNDFYGPPMINIYKVSYDKYIYPEIIGLIDGVLNGENKMILQLLDYKYEDDDEKTKQQNKIQKMLDDKDLLNSDEKIFSLESILKEYKNTRYGKSVKKYINKVKQCIEIYLVDEYSYEQYQRFCSFLYLDDEKVLNDCNNNQKCLQSH